MLLTLACALAIGLLYHVREAVQYQSGEKPMKLLAPVLLVALSACSAPSDTTGGPESATSPSTATVPTASDSASPVTASASGTVEAVDVAAKTVTLAHGPIDALQWPAMTMTFKAPEADLTTLRTGDHVVFELTSSQGDQVVTKITKQ